MTGEPMFKHTPSEAEARITALERELAALRAASAEFMAAYHSLTGEIDGDIVTKMRRFTNARDALKALLAEGETDG